MYVTKRVVRALNIAYCAHSQMFDKTGAPYIFHSYRVADSMERRHGSFGKVFDVESLTVVALFHDVLEDVFETKELFQTTLRIYDFELNDDEWRWLDALTRRQGETYDDYINRAMREPESRIIKLEDIKDHLEWKVVGCPLPASLIQRYERAYNKLVGV